MDINICKYYVIPGHETHETECGNKLLEDYTIHRLERKLFKYCPFCGGKIIRLRETKPKNKQYELF